MTAGRRALAFAPAWMWLFWLAGALVIAAGLRRGGEPQPLFLVSNGPSLEIWRGADRQSTLLHYDDGSTFKDPALSLDGSQIAFVRVLPVTLNAAGEDDFGTDLYVSRRDGSDARLVVRHSVLSEYIESPVWLTSGREVVYAIVTPHVETGTADQRLEAVDVETGRRRRLRNDAEWPALMPDGRHVLFTSIGDRPDTGPETPMLLDLETGGAGELPGYRMKLIFINSYQLSPDGSTIAFAAAQPGEDLPVQFPQRGSTAPVKLHPIYQDIWLMDTDGNNLRNIADLGVATPSIAWSPDGAWVYVMSTQGFLRVNATTGAQENLRSGIQYSRLRLLS